MRFDYDIPPTNPAQLGLYIIQQFQKLQRVLAAMPLITNISMSSDANRTLTTAEADTNLMVITSTVSLTATRDIVLPLWRGKELKVVNSTIGGQSLQFISGSGTGITVASTKSAILVCDGTNWIRITADAA